MIEDNDLVKRLEEELEAERRRIFAQWCAEAADEEDEDDE